MHLPARACGIDFGTSNSTVGWLRPAAPTLLLLEDDKPTLPSAVFFNADENCTHFGRDALAQYLEGYDGRLMRALKSLLGSSLIDGQTEVGGRALRFRELLASFIGELKRRAEAQAGRSFESAVFGRPVHFVDADDSADRQAQDTLEAIAREVGFREVSFQFEPIGAALHYERSLNAEALVLIADIGGTDFDRALSLDCVMPLLGYRGLMKNGAHTPASIYFQLATWHTINAAYSRRAWTDLQNIYRDALAREELDRLARLISQRDGHWLALQVEQAKIDLSGAARADIELERLAPGLVHSIDTADFVAATAALVERVGACVEALLQDAGLRRDQVDTVYFTGGGSGVPQLRARISAVLPGARSVEGELYGSIGAGLAVEAARRYG